MLVGNIRVPERCPNRETIPSRHSCPLWKSLANGWQHDAWIMANITAWNTLWQNYLVGGFNPSEKYESHLEVLFPIYIYIIYIYIWKNKMHVPNHQPVMVMVESSWKPLLTIGDSSRLHTWAHSLGISWQTLADQKNAWDLRRCMACLR